MPTMNETSTITLPEYHNLLALLLLNINTPPVSSSSTTQEEETMLTQNQGQDKTAEQNKSSSIIPGERSRPHTQDTPSKKRQVSHQKKERQTKPVYHHEHANTNHTPERRITPQRDKTKKKNHTTHSRAHPPPGTQTHNPIPSATHSTFLLLLPTLPSYIPAMTHSYTLSASFPHS